MLIRNTSTRYGIVAIFLHWIMAVIVIGLLILGLYMTDLPKGLVKLQWYGLHKSLGITILALVFIRIIWRFLNNTPSLAASPAWERLSAISVHYVLYFCMIVMPLTGWMMSSSAGISVSFFGLFVLPDLVSPDKNLHELCEFIHGWTADFLIAIICLHVAASLKHYFINKDRILQRILWP